MQHSLLDIFCCYRCYLNNDSNSVKIQKNSRIINEHEIPIVEIKIDYMKITIKYIYIYITKTITSQDTNVYSYN